MEENNRPTFVYRNHVLADGNYVEWLADIKSRFRKSQIKAAVRVNTTMLEFYWSLGRDIVVMQAESKWGSGFFDQLSLDMKAEFPNEAGFSVTNLKYMKRWYDFYYQRVVNRQRPVDEIGHQLGDQLTGEKSQRVVDELEMPETFGLIPWGQHIEIFSKCQTLDEALFYIEETIENNWTLVPSKYIEFIDHDLEIDYPKEMARIQQEMRDLMQREKESQRMLEEAFRGIGYSIE